MCAQGWVSNTFTQSSVRCPMCKHTRPGAHMPLGSKCNSTQHSRHKKNAPKEWMHCGQSGWGHKASTRRGDNSSCLTGRMSYTCALCCDVRSSRHSLRCVTCTTQNVHSWMSRLLVAMISSHDKQRAAVHNCTAIITISVELQCTVPRPNVAAGKLLLKTGKLDCRKLKSGRSNMPCSPGTAVSQLRSAGGPGRLPSHSPAEHDSAVVRWVGR